MGRALWHSTSSCAPGTRTLVVSCVQFPSISPKNRTLTARRWKQPPPPPTPGSGVIPCGRVVRAAGQALRDRVQGAPQVEAGGQEGAHQAHRPEPEGARPGGCPGPGHNGEEDRVCVSVPISVAGAQSVIDTPHPCQWLFLGTPWRGLQISVNPDFLQ